MQFVLVALLVVAGAGAELCRYSCTEGGGCSVQYTGPPRSGPTLGSCFPPSFGGACSGVPPECEECTKQLDCEKGGRRS